MLAASYPGYRAFLRDADDPRKALDRVWRELWWQIEKAPFWRERMGEPGRRTPPLSAFPVTDYGTYREALEASYRGRVSELSGDPIRAFAKRPGVHGPPLPISDRSRAHDRRALGVYLHTLARRYRGVLRRPVLYVPGRIERSPAGLDVALPGDDELRHAPVSLRRHFAAPLEVFCAGEGGASCAAAYALAGDLSAILGASAATVAAFVGRMLTGLRDIWPLLTGRERPPPELPPVAASRERLAHLKRALAREPLSLKEVWPGLQLVCTAPGPGDGAARSTLEELSQGRVPILEAGAVGAEGRVAVPDAAGGRSAVLHPGAHAVEFLPEGAEPAARNLLQAPELEPGETYAPVVSTAAGLVRCRLEVRARCQGWVLRSPTLSFEPLSG